MRMRWIAVGVVLGCFVVSGAELVLYEKDSPYNHIVVTEDESGLRSLLFDDPEVLQSVVKVGDPDHLHLPYARAVFAGLAFVEPPRRVLIVGLGGGTIPQFLRKHYPGLTIDVVDIDPDVVAVARQFFGFTEDARMKAHVADGRKFIESCRVPYDIVFLDAYSSDNIPYHLATREFLAAVRRALAPKGIVVGNLWSRYSNKLYDSMINTYRAAFDEFCVFDVRGSGNKIVVALAEKRAVDREGLGARARDVAKRDGFPYDLGEIVDYGFRDASTERSDAPVLTDAGAPGKGEKKPGG